MMTNKEARDLMEDALRDIELAEAKASEAHAADTTANFAVIAQAKMLALIASALTEMNQRDRDRYINQP